MTSEKARKEGRKGGGRDRLWRMAAMLWFSLVLGLSAESPRARLPVVTTALAAHNLSASEAAKGYPIRLRAVVTFYDPGPKFSLLFVTDSKASIYVSLADRPVAEFHNGDLVEVTGISDPGEYAPVVAHATVRRIGASHFPATAPKVTLNDILKGELDGQWVEVEGVVRGVRVAVRHTYLDLALRDGTTTAMTVRNDGVDYSDLVDATIRLRGNAGTVFNNQRQMTGAHVLFPGLETLRVVQSAPASPFSQPVQRVGDLLHFSAQTGFQHRVHVQGTVTLDLPGSMLCIQDEGRGLCAQVNQTEAVSRGERVDLVGFPTIGAFSPTLLHATYRLSAGHEFVSATNVSADAALLGGLDAKLVSMQARVIGHDQSATDSTVFLLAGHSVFSAMLPRKYMAESSELLEGSLVRISGICSIQTDESRRDEGSGFPIPTSIRILLESPADISVIQGPSWWTPSHALRVMALALVLALAALAGVLILSRRVRRQTVTIRDSEARFRHLATHDGLTQLPNRASVMHSLEKIAQHARLSGTPVCVALIDLDHFKQINDTLGHLAGDEVLRQSALRLASAIRSSDLIGRYGGEEFLVVLEDTELERGIDRCEDIRRALCGEPIRWNEQDLTITCSIGVAAAKMLHGSIPVLISVADGAMYAAKRQGRNRVVGASIAVANETAYLTVG
jgi:diguanylate cyclase (GGDEF)-like protein